MSKTPFNIDSINGELTPFPVSDVSTPFQVCTQVGTTVLTASTSAGLIIILPNWAEKILGWHYPMDPATSTFGAPEAIPFSLDIDQFYERFRLISAIYSIQAGTVSTTNAALSGSFNAVEAYNSISSLQGNGTSVYQIYSYGNTMGLSPDVARRAGAIPSWKGVSLIHLNTPRKKWSRLEDGTSFTSSTHIDASASRFKYVDINDSYALSGGFQFDLPSPIPFNTTLSLPSYTYSSGQVLVDAVRSCDFSWVVTAGFSVTNTDGSSVNGTKAMKFIWRYILRDIAGNIQDSGILETEYTWVAEAYGVVNFTKSGSFPTALNINEANLKPPIRTLEVLIDVAAVAPGNGSWDLIWNVQPSCNLWFPVYNGLVSGLIQNPLIVNYAGVEVGTKITMNGSLRLETIADSSTAKFVTPLYRHVRMIEEAAINKVLANPLKYGVKYIVPTDQLQNTLDTFNSAIQLQVSDGVDKVLQSWKHAANLSNEKGPQAEASVRSLLKKGFKALKNVGKQEMEEVIRPAANEILHDISGLTKSAANAALRQALESVVTSAATYVSPSVSYMPLNQSKINAQAAAGWAGPAYAAATEMPKNFKLDNSQRLYHSHTENNHYLIPDDPSDPYLLLPSSITNVPRDLFVTTGNGVYTYGGIKVLLLTHPKASIAQTPTFTVDKTSCTLFPGLYLDNNDELKDEHLDDAKSVGSIFAIVPLRDVNLPSGSVRTKVGAHWVYNYSSTKSCPSLTPIDPGQDVALMRINSSTADCFVVVSPDKPVTGRSIDLALWAFSRGIKRGFVFSGQVEAGKVLPLSVPVGITKLKLVTERNRFMLVANIPSAQNHSLIQVDSLISVAPTLLKISHHATPLDSDSWRSASPYPITKYLTDAIKTRWFNTAWSPLTDVYISYDTRELLVVSYPVYFGAPKFRRCTVAGSWKCSDEVEYVNWAVALSIGEMHAFNLALLETLPMQECLMQHVDYRNCIAVAMTKPCAAVTITSPEFLSLILRARLNDAKFVEELTSPNTSVAAARKLLNDLELAAVNKKFDGSAIKGGKIVAPRTRKTKEEVIEKLKAPNAANRRFLNDLSDMFQKARKVSVGDPDLSNNLKLYQVCLKNSTPMPVANYNVVKGIMINWDGKDQSLPEVYKKICADHNKKPRLE